MPERFSTRSNSAEVHTSADSLRENHDQLNSKENEQITQQKSQEKNQFESDLTREIQNIDSQLDKELNEPVIHLKTLKSFIETNYPNNKTALQVARQYIQQQNVFGFDVPESELREKIEAEILKEQSLSKGDQIIKFKEQLSNKGKSSVFILKSLIEKFGNDPDVSTWTENWKKFLRLHELAKTKSPKERRVIQGIIAKADFTNENSFSESLQIIRSSSELSKETKLEIFAEFDGSRITSISQMDAGLNLLKDRKREVNSLLNTKIDQLSNLDSDIQNLKEKLNDLPSDSSERKKLENQLNQKTLARDKSQELVDTLKLESQKEVAFEIRSGFSVELSNKGNRTVKNPENFSLQLPSNTLPFTGSKNLRAMNLAFVCAPLNRLGIMNEVFTPNLYSGDVPSKAHRNTGHTILKALGIADRQILSEKEIEIIDRDLSRIMYSGMLSPREHLVKIGLYDVREQSFDMDKFKKVLKFARENRGMGRERFSMEIKKLFKGDSTETS